MVYIVVHRVSKHDVKTLIDISGLEIRKQSIARRYPSLPFQSVCQKYVSCRVTIYLKCKKENQLWTVNKSSHRRF